MSKFNALESYALMRAVRQVLVDSPVVSPEMKEAIQNCHRVRLCFELDDLVEIKAAEADSSSKSVTGFMPKNIYRDLVESLERFEHLAFSNDIFTEVDEPLRLLTEEQRDAMVSSPLREHMLSPEQLAAYNILMKDLNTVAKELESGQASKKHDEAISFLRLSTQCGGDKITLRYGTGDDAKDALSETDEGMFWTLKTLCFTYWADCFVKGV